MPLSVAVSSAPTGIQQRVAAGAAFDDTVPTTAVTFANGLNKFAEDTAGGLFFFENLRPVVITYYAASFGAPVDYQVAIVSLDENNAKIPGDRIVIAEGTAANIIGPAQYGFTLGARQALEILAEASGSAMIAQAWGVDATALLTG
jgi:hypothetical protein